MVIENNRFHLQFCLQFSYKKFNYLNSKSTIDNEILQQATLFCYKSYKRFIVYVNVYSNCINYYY